MYLTLTGIARLILLLTESSRPEVFCKKGILKNFTKFTGKHLRQSLLFNKIVGLRLLILTLKQYEKLKTFVLKKLFH